MFPYKIDIEIKKIPFVTIILILTCTILHFVPSHIRNNFIKSALVPLDFVYLIFNPKIESFTILFTLIFSFFIHANFFHLASNMWYLWLFGSALENKVGSKNFFLVYLVSGIISMIIQIATNPLSTIPIVGASGAIAGIMGMYLLISPFSKVVLWLPPIFSLRVFSFIFLLFWFWIQWENLSSQNRVTSNIAWWAHIGGFICGIVYGLKYLIFDKRKKFKIKK